MLNYFLKINFLVLILTSITVNSLFANEKLRLIVFLSEECPISQYYTKELNSIAFDYNAYLNTIVYFPMLSSTQEKMKVFKESYKLNIPCRLDEKQSLAIKYNVTTTPEVILLIGDSILYQGRIDDAFLTVGSRRKVVKERNLREAIDSYKEKLPQKVKYVKPVGCLITFEPKEEKKDK
jgi:thioredoxin-related protein